MTDDRSPVLNLLSSGRMGVGSVSAVLFAHRRGSSRVLLGLPWSVNGESLWIVARVQGEGVV